jgi:uncharacterized repeat protein (TIGR03803 family)
VRGFIARSPIETPQHLEVAKLGNCLFTTGGIMLPSIAPRGEMPRIGLRRREALAGLVSLALAPAVGRPATTPDARIRTILAFSTANAKMPSTPMAGLIRGHDGFLYGTTSIGGEKRGGTVYRLRAPFDAEVLCSLGAHRSMWEPLAPVVQASNGLLYGTANLGGASSSGGLFRVSMTGVMKHLHDFSWFDGSDCSAPLIQASDGKLYGTTALGGALGGGTIFRIDLDGRFELLRDMGGTDGGDLYAGLVQGSDGRLYGAAAGGTIFAMGLDGSFVVLHRFTGPDGSFPMAALAEGPDGWFYGTTRFGGAFGDGTIYRISSHGDFESLVSFDQHDSVGAWPSDPLLVASDGAIYGITGWLSGRDDVPASVFRLRAARGSVQVVGGFPPGSRLVGALLEHGGTLIGATSAGGPKGGGEVYQIELGISLAMQTPRFDGP